MSRIRIWTLPLLLSFLLSISPISANTYDGIQSLLMKPEVSEMSGRVCAYADFDSDRSTDLLLYHGGQLVVHYQREQEFVQKDGDKRIPLVIDVGHHEEIACSMGDINGDGLHDVVVSTRGSGNGHWTVRYYLRVSKTEGFGDPSPRFEAHDEVAMMDVTGDGIHDIVGVMTDGDLLCITGIAGGQPALHVKNCSDYFPEWEGPLFAHMPILYADLDNDGYSEITFMTVDDKKLRPEVWQRRGDTWRRMETRLPPLPVNVVYTLAPMVADLDLDARTDLLVPLCSDKACSRVESLVGTHWMEDKEAWQEWKSFPVDLRGSLLVDEHDTLARIRVGDFTLDGYPDLLVTIVNATGGINKAAVVENIPIGEESEGGKLQRMFRTPTSMLVMPPLALGTTQSSHFFDFQEDGYLDVLVMWKMEDDSWGTGIILSVGSQHTDATFLKVQTFMPLPGYEDIKDGLGVTWGGACVKYEMETNELSLKETKRRAIDCQLPATSHKGGLSPPFALFGLGRNPNYVSEVHVHVPRATTEDARRHHVQKQIVPNARMMAQPPGAAGSSWVLRLYITPSGLIFSSLAVMASTCALLLLVVFLLHFREKKFDRVERQAQSHRFHFDAM